MIIRAEATPESVGLNTFEDQYAVIDKTCKLGEKLAAALSKM